MVRAVFQRLHGTPRRSTISGFSLVLHRIRRVRATGREDGITKRIADLAWALRDPQVADKVNSGAVGLFPGAPATLYDDILLGWRSCIVVYIGGDTATAKTMLSGHFPDVLEGSWAPKCQERPILSICDQRRLFTPP